ncbi:kallikrein-13 isoform X6 [Manis javanica]|uniref:kallikrein-13 isoform X6 n=1 Tax=Manis javanica TaxID=9974 RepID=UPI003C6D3D8D
MATPGGQHIKSSVPRRHDKNSDPLPKSWDHNSSGYRVYLGKHALGRVEAGEQVRKVVRSIPHPHYQVSPTHQNHEHDIMLLGLQSPVRLGGRIRVLPLSHEDRLPPGTCCRVSGWGTTTSPQVSYPQALQCANIQLRSEEECRRIYPGRITPNMLCAGTEEGGKDSCEGDSGGPLTCNGTLHGIISWGDLPCGQPDRPGVYTRVSRYVSWIQETIRKYTTQKQKWTKGPQCPHARTGFGVTNRFQ